MNLLTMEHVSKAYTDRVLLDDVGFGINKNEKIGVIGVNGMGKSTLLKIVAGIEESDAGTISMGNQVKICYLPQTPVFEAGTTILRAATEGNYDELNRWTIEAEAKSMLQRIYINPTAYTGLCSIRPAAKAASVTVTAPAPSASENASTIGFSKLLDEQKALFEQEVSDGSLWNEDSWMVAYVLCGHHRRPAAGHLYPGSVYRTAAGNGPDVTETFHSSPKKGGTCFAAGTAFSVSCTKADLCAILSAKGGRAPCADGLF